MYGKTPPVGRKPIIYIMGGGTASGKSTASKKIIGESKSKNFVRADPDDIKLTIPEYEGLKNSDPDHAGFRVHDESSHMTKMLLAQAGAKGLDIIYDSTTSGDTGPETIKQFQSKGYDVRVMFFDAPMKDAIAREEWRSKNSDDPANFGRRVPMHIMVANHVGAAKNFMGIKDLPGLTAKQFYDTTQREPKLVYDRTDNAGETIHDEDRWQRYQRKAGGDVHASVDRLSRRPVSNKSGHRRVQAAVGRS
jgi:predicted ABC-type ATPase